jgi:hypothetical protein
VPVIRSADDHRIDVRPLEKFSEVFISFRALPCGYLNFLNPAVQDRLVHIAECYTGHFRQGQMVPQDAKAHASATDKCNSDLIARWGMSSCFRDGGRKP